MKPGDHVKWIHTVAGEKPRLRFGWVRGCSKNGQYARVKPNTENLVLVLPTARLTVIKEGQ